MGINFNALYRSFQSQVAQPAPQYIPVAAAPAPVEETPYQAASEAQSEAAQGMEAARAIGGAFAGFVTGPAAPAAPQTERQIIQSIQNAITPEMLARFQAQYQVSPTQRAANLAAAQGLL